MHHRSVDVDGKAASYLTAGEGQPVLLLHGRYWSRVWQPVIDLSPSATCGPSRSIFPAAGAPWASLT